MKTISLTKILAAAILPFILVYVTCSLIVTGSAKNRNKDEALRVAEHFVINAKYGIEIDSSIKQFLISEDGMILSASEPAYIGRSLVSLVVEKNPIQTAERISEYIAKAIEGDEILAKEYNSILRYGRAYMGISVVYPDVYPDSVSFVFIEIPSELLVLPYEDLSLLILPIGIAGVFLIFTIVFFTAKGVFKREKEFLAASCEKKISESEQKPPPAAFSHSHTSNQFIHESEAAPAFLGKISREIRTPMSSILGIAQIMLAEDRLSEAHKKYVSDIKDSADRLLKTINDVIDLSRLTTGKMPLELHDYNFIQLIDSISAAAKSAAEEKGLQYSFSIADKLPQCLYGDDEKLKKILQCLISNAVKFTEKGSVSFNISVSDNNLIFEIRDTGKGIPPEASQNLFEPFNTGLGLPISSALCKLMDGEITVAGGNESGSSFTVTLPIIKGDKSKLKTKSVKSDLFFSKDTRVLIVDDNETNLHVIKGLVSSLYGIHCDTALSGLEAVFYAESYNYDLILMDHMMPDIDGVEAMQRIRGKGMTSVPIIAVTANAVPGTGEELVKAGMNDFLYKPIIIDDMNTLLQKWLPSEKRKKKSESSQEVDDLLSFMEKGGRIITAAMSISELDVNAGLSNVSFKEDVFENSLRLLLDTLPKITLLMNECLAAENFHDFTTHALGMKGLLIAVGAASLAEAAGILEEAGKENDIELCKANLPDFVFRLQNLEGKLKSIFSTEASSQKKTGTNEILNECLNALTEAIEKYNYDLLIEAVTRINEFDFGLAVNSDISKIKILADSFDYDGIITAVSELKAELESNPLLLKS
jgi:signal transduction histidine kinase/response regulator of citrate/malate metabolism